MSNRNEFSAIHEGETVVGEVYDDSTRVRVSVSAYGSVFLDLEGPSLFLLDRPGDVKALRKILKQAEKLAKERHA